MTELKLPKKFQNIINAFLGRLQDTYKDDLISVILYGSAASGEFAGRHSDINLLIVLKNTGMPSLHKISKVIKKSRFQAIKPHFFTEDYIKSSLDVFPIEFLDIKENFIILYGKDVLSALHVDIKNLRFQCEQELKSKLIHIKNLYLRNRSKCDLHSLLFKSFNSTTHILRNLLRLKGKTPPYLKSDIINEASKEFHIDTTALAKILEAKKKNSRLRYKDIESLLFALAENLENIINMVDRL